MELTVIAVWEPVTVEVTVSVAVMLLPVPAVFSVAEKVPVPLVRVELAGSPLPAVDWVSFEVKCTVPA